MACIKNFLKILAIMSAEFGNPIIYQEFLKNIKPYFMILNARVRNSLIRELDILSQVLTYFNRDFYTSKNRKHERLRQLNKDEIQRVKSGSKGMR